MDDKLNLQEICKLTASMRRMQNKYFSTREQQYLVASKEAERLVDAKLFEFGYSTVSPEDRNQQQRLFG